MTAGDQSPIVHRRLWRTPAMMCISGTVFALYLMLILMMSVAG